MTKPLRVALYLRVSKRDQTEENQRTALRQVAEQRGWQTVEYVDHGISGAKGREKRPNFDRMCKDATAGKLDLIAAWSLDRLARSISHLVRFGEEIRAANVGLFVLKQQIDTETPAGRLMFTMLGAIAEFEREIIRERINAGIERARKHGTKSGNPHGRPRKIDPQIEDAVRLMRSQKHGKLKIAKSLGIGVHRVDRILRRPHDIVRPSQS